MVDLFLGHPLFGGGLHVTLETRHRPNSSAGVTQGLTPNLVFFSMDSITRNWSHRLYMHMAKYGEPTTLS